MRDKSRGRYYMLNLVTGGCGFIGSHLVDALMHRGDEVIAFDNLSSGWQENVAHWKNNKRFKLILGDCRRESDIVNASQGSEVLFHLAAEPEVRLTPDNTKKYFEQNILATYNVLELIRKSRKIQKFIFTSSSTIYGDAEVLPTPEDYGPLKPISVYGGSKLACEAMVTAYAETYGIHSVIVRLANIYGSRGRRGIILDFIMKLKINPSKLTILGDGKQRKSCLHVSDCVEAILLASNHANRHAEVFNVGSWDQIDVTSIAQIVSEEMGLKEVVYEFSGGVNGGRGWIGDVKDMFLDISKLRKTGWRPKYDSSESVRLATREILMESKYHKPHTGV